MYHSHRKSLSRLSLLFVVALLFTASGCDWLPPLHDDDDRDDDEREVLDLSLCAVDENEFTHLVDHPFFPLEPGSQSTLEGEEDGATIRVVITVLDETEDVAGVTTQVVEERETEDGDLVEISRNFFAQTDDGTVCYFGEDVDDYEDGEIVSNEGAWRADEPGNAPGIFIPAEPEEDTQYLREAAPGIAEDMAAVLDIGETVTVPAGTFEETLRIEEWNPLEGQVLGDGDEKVYAPGVGLIVDGPVELISQE